MSLWVKHLPSFSPSIPKYPNTLPQAQFIMSFFSHSYFQKRSTLFSSFWCPISLGELLFVVCLYAPLPHSVPLLLSNHRQGEVE